MRIDARYRLIVGWGQGSGNDRQGGMEWECEGVNNEADRQRD